MKSLSKYTILFLFALVACAPPPNGIKLQTGDLLFRRKTGGKLSEAIDKVTQTAAETHFSHVGLTEVVGDSVFVLHASPNGGTCRVSLQQFLNPPGDSTEVVAYRLKEQWQTAIPAAIKHAHAMLGKPYNFTYILSDTAHYCSEFIYRAFAGDSVFELNPMTFKDPATNQFFDTWIEYYQKLGVDIPEGLPGCNPNGMAASDKLERIGTIML